MFYPCAASREENSTGVHAVESFQKYKILSFHKLQSHISAPLAWALSYLYIASLELLSMLPDLWRAVIAGRGYFIGRRDEDEVINFHSFHHNNIGLPKSVP